METAHWFVGAGRAEREAKTKETAALRRRQDEEAREEEGKPPLPPLPNVKDTVQGALRLFAIARIVVGVMVDGVRVFVVYFTSLFTEGVGVADRYRLLALLCYLRSPSDLGVQLVGRTEGGCSTCNSCVFANTYSRVAAKRRSFNHAFFKNAIQASSCPVDYR